MSTIAVLLALCGSAYAVGLGRNSVGSKQLKPGAVKLKDTATALRLKCLPGTRYHEGACIETAKRPARQFPDALLACSAAGRRLPGPSELMGFAREPGIAIGAQGPNPEWTSSVDYAPPAVNALAVSEVNSDVLISTDPISDSHAFRCAANALG